MLHDSPMDSGAPDHHRPVPPDRAAPTRRPALDAGGGDVGSRLRQLRQERDLSLSELARRAGVGKATLSGLENGTRNPTLETLYAVTAGLGVPLAAVLARRSEGKPAVLRGTAVEATLLEIFDDPTVTAELYRLRVPPGPVQTSPAHHPGVTEHVTVFAGVLRAGPVDAPMLAGPGEHIRWQSDVPHVYGAYGDEEVLASLLVRYPRR